MSAASEAAPYAVVIADDNSDLIVGCEIGSLFGSAEGAQKFAAEYADDLPDGQRYIVIKYELVN